MAENVTTAVLEEWVRRFAQLVAENRDYLTELDAAIGDADHGSNMDRGMKAAVAALDASPPATAGRALLQGGHDAGLDGRRSQRAIVRDPVPADGQLARRRRDASATDVAAALRAGLGGVVDRGKAGPGDKTMYDALAPAVDALDAALGEGADLAAGLKVARDAAAAGRDATTPMLARKGRASYLGERSVGHQDPGATTVALLLEAATEAPF